MSGIFLTFVSFLIHIYLSFYTLIILINCHKERIQFFDDFTINSTDIFTVLLNHLLISCTNTLITFKVFSVNLRTSTGVTFTGIGERIVGAAQNILKEEQYMSQMIAEYKQQAHRENVFPVRICSASAIINVVLPDIIARFSHVNVNIIPRIFMADSLQEVFQQVESGKCDLGLLTYNEEELFRQFAKYQHVLDMDLLARDDQVVVMDQHMYRAGQEYVTGEEFSRQFCTMFCLTPIDKMAHYTEEVHVTCSNDADFHRAMIKRANAYVLMPRLAYQYFFSGKSYVALPLEGHNHPMLHAAVYRKDAAEEMKKFTSLIRINLQ